MAEPEVFQEQRGYSDNHLRTIKTQVKVAKFYCYQKYVKDQCQTYGSFSCFVCSNISSQNIRSIRTIIFKITQKYFNNL